MGRCNYHNRKLIYKIKLFPKTGSLPDYIDINERQHLSSIDSEDLVVFFIYSEEFEKLNKYGNFDLYGDCWKAKVCDKCKISFEKDFKDENYDVEISLLR